MKFKLKLNEIKKGEKVGKPHIGIYLFFLVHMFGFGSSGFFLAYDTNTIYLMALMHGGIAIFVYIIFYIAIFGLDAIKWMVINAIIGISQTYYIIDSIGGVFINNWSFDNYPFYRHIIPAIYIVLYTFLVRRFILHFLGEDNLSNTIFLLLNGLVYLSIWYF